MRLGLGFGFGFGSEEGIDDKVEFGKELLSSGEAFGRIIRYDTTYYPGMEWRTMKMSPVC